MNHKKKVDIFIKDMEKYDIDRSEIAPFTFRLLWFLGFEIPPPFFMTPWKIGIISGLFFGIFMAIFGLLVQDIGLGIFFFILCSIGFAISFGRWTKKRRLAYKLEFPSWEEYPKKKIIKGA